MRRLTLADWVLVAAALLGAAALWGLPAVHPDRAGSMALGHDGARAAADAFLRNAGFPLSGLSASAYYGQDPALLMAVQDSLGRREALAALRVGGAERVPAHHWRVVYRPTPGADASADPKAYEVFVTQGGQVWRVRNTRGALPGGGVDRATLEQALRDADAAAPLLELALPDTALASLLTFDPAGTPSLDADRTRAAVAAEVGQPQALGPAAATAIARAHLGRTAWAAWPLEPVGVEPIAERGRLAARVRFASAEPALGQEARVDVDVTAAGALLGLAAEFGAGGARAEPLADEDATWTFTVGEARVAHGIRWAVYIALVLVLLVVLLRRIGARMLDAKVALRDGLFAALLAAVMIATSFPMAEFQAGAEAWQQLVWLGFGMLFLGAGVALLVFVTSAASDALAREAFTRKLRALSLVRQGRWVNGPVGAALLRGVALGVGICGLTVALLALLPGAPIAYDDSWLHVTEATVSVFATAWAAAGWTNLFLATALLLGAGALAWPHGRGWAFAVLAALLTLTLAVPADVSTPLWAAWACSAAVGAAVAAVFVRFDALAALVGLWLADILYVCSVAGLPEASPATLDVVLASGLTVGFALLGWAGVRSGREGETLPEYVPEYVADVAERERMRHELSIAREVQLSFLPRQMPVVPGLDVAAACRPAEEVGGDYYDVFTLADGRLVLVVGDVSGKGVPAAFYMTLLKGLMRTLAPDTEIAASPRTMLTRANRLFCESARAGTFVTMIYAVMDPARRTLTFARAGHNPLVRLRPGRPAEQRQPPGLALGLVRDARFEAVLREETLTLAPGEAVVLYTDGFSEAMNAQRRLFGDDRLADALAGMASRPTRAKDLLNGALGAVHVFAAGAEMHDDMTMVVLRLDPALAASIDPASNGAAQDAPTPDAPAFAPPPEPHA